MGEKLDRATRPPEAGDAAATPPEPAGPTGIPVIEAHVKALPGRPGVYRTINAKGEVLYVGKAKNLKKRVASYARPDRQTIRIRRMVAETAAMEFITTHTEAEALLLESNLIKRYAPRFNILLRDDKSFPSILVTSDHPFPQVVKHRGARARPGDYFGPFASAWAVNETLNTLQRAFLLRSCSDSVFAGRTRPCLLHQIKRCSAPCVGRIGAAEYRTLVEEARLFLSGGSKRIQERLAREMQEASDSLEFERAAQVRDRIRALSRVQARQDINLRGIDEADVVAAHAAGGQTCVQVFFFRGGCNYGNRAYFPSHGREDETAAVLEAFVGQFYARVVPPKLVLVSHALPGQALVAEALGLRAGHRVEVVRPTRGERRNAVAHAAANAAEALSRRLAANAQQRDLLERLARWLALDGTPQRIEVYDNSHVSGAKAVGAMIVAGPDGFQKGAYRKFTIRGGARATAADGPAAGRSVECAQPGDDYAMMREVLTRRFARALADDAGRDPGNWPDLVLIDGGSGHLGVALRVLEELGIDDVVVAAIAKGPDRNAGRERIYLPGRAPLQLEPRDPVLYFLQRLRDEAHRFAVGAHRSQRSRSLSQSRLDEIPGIGAKRKRALLHHFGAASAVAEAGLADLEAVQGISRATARKIYDWFHAEG